jgi:hypothetical protein
MADADRLPYLAGDADTSPRPGFVYFSRDGDLAAARFDNFKMIFIRQRAAGTLQIWVEPQRQKAASFTIDQALERPEAVLTAHR